MCHKCKTPGQRNSGTERGVETSRKSKRGLVGWGGDSFPWRLPANATLPPYRGHRRRHDGSSRSVFLRSRVPFPVPSYPPPTLSPSPSSVFSPTFFFDFRSLLLPTFHPSSLEYHPLPFSPSWILFPSRNR